MFASRSYRPEPYAYDIVEIEHQINQTTARHWEEKIHDKSYSHRPSVNVRKPQFSKGIWTEAVGFSLSTDTVTLRRSFLVRWP